MRPDHLFLGTNRDNIQDLMDKGLHLKGLRHPLARFTPEEVQVVKGYLSEGLTQVQIAVILCCCKKTVWRVKNGDFESEDAA